MKTKIQQTFLLFLIAFNGLAKLPEKVIILTFDDAIASQSTNTAKILNEYGFGATFFVCEFPPNFDTDKENYMTWEQIKELSDMGFEIGNHTRTHVNITKISDDSLISELEYIDSKCRKYNIEVPSTFAYPGYSNDSLSINVLRQKKYWYARAGGGRPYNIEKDDPFLLPSYDIAGTDTSKVYRAIRTASQGNVVILTIHGVPDNVHPWVNTPPELFKEYMDYLKKNNYTVWSLKTLHDNLYSNLNR
ncbi:MAG TPA: polysaccharide deacetylase [Prolixibacteraceae bacterium]|nr:polysaccharide deacetylase [Prolixibacteraceae bacterium]HCU63371.1 polysaccharide deacetylase [Prolixibacteraceae bacterium]